MTKITSLNPIAGLSKYTAPESRHWLKRLHLFARLDQFAALPVVWVAAPAGSGKTVLVASYLGERKRTVLWYRVDTRDNDPGAFFHRLREAAQQCGIVGAERLPVLTGEYAGGEEAFARNFFERLCVGAPDGFALVFDDFQQLPEDAPLQMLISPIFDSIPSTCTAFVLSRHSPPAAVARMRANQQIGVLDETELRLDEAETAALVGAWPAASRSSVSIEALHKRMQGWAAGVVLTLEHHGRDVLSESPALNEDVIFDYFAAEVVSALDKDERELLLSTALPNQFDGALAQAMSGNQQSVALLDGLIRRNLFVYQEKTTYRYHPLFRDFLLRTLERELTPTQLDRIRLRVASLLLERDELDMALPLLKDAANWERFVGVLLEMAPAMMAQGRHRELTRWLKDVPEVISSKSPWLGYWLATSHLPTDYFTSYDLYYRAYLHFVDRGDLFGSILAWIGAVDAIIFSLSDVSRLDVWLPRFEPLLTGFGADPDEEIIGQLASRITSILMLRQPDHPELGRWREIAERSVARMADANLRTLSGFYLSTHDIWCGDLDRAAAFADRTNREADSLPPLAATANILMHAWLDWTSGRYEACRRTFARGIKFAEKTGVQVWTVVLWAQGVTNALIRGAVEEAEGYLAQIEPRLAQMRDMDRAYYFIGCAWAELLRGDKAQSLAYQRRALEAAERFGAVYTLAEAHFGMAQVWHELGDAASAREHLQQAQVLGDRLGSWTMAFQCTLAQAQFALDGGARSSALKPLRTAFDQARRHGIVTYNGWRPSVMARLSALALEHGIETDLARSLIDRFRLPPPEDESCDDWPWPVRIHTLGRFALEVDGKPIDLSAGKHGRPCTLLKQLIAAEPHGIAESRLAEILWHDADGDVAMLNLRTNLHRLRKLLGHGESVLVIQGRASVNSRICHSDVQALGNLLRIAQNAPDAELPRFAERLLATEPEEFLPGEEGDLIIRYRTQLSHRLQSTLLLMADKLRHNGHGSLAEALVARSNSIDQDNF